MSVDRDVCRRHCDLLDDGAGGGEFGEVEVCSREEEQKSERIRVRMRGRQVDMEGAEAVKVVQDVQRRRSFLIGRPSLSLVLWEFSSCLKGAFPSHCVGVISYPREVFVWPVFQTVVHFECLFLFLLFKCATLQLSDSRRSESAQGCSAY